MLRTNDNMSLTLTINDETPEVELILINSGLDPFQFIYHFNTLFNLNFAKSSTPISLKRNKQSLEFNYYLWHDDSLDSHTWIIDNTVKTIDQSNLFFGLEQQVEQTHHLLKSKKNFDLIILVETEFLHQLTIGKIKQIPNLLQINKVLLHEINKVEQQTILNIYYEKQD